MTENARFLTFKPSGKWKYEGRGNASEMLFKRFGVGERRAQVLADNGGLMPGMSTSGSDLIVVVIPDEDHDSGWPLLLLPENET